MSPLSPPKVESRDETELARPSVVVALLGSGDPEALCRTADGLLAAAREVGVRVVLAWPRLAEKGDLPEAVTSAVEVLPFPPEVPADERRRQAQAHCGSDIVVFVEEAGAADQPWLDILSLRAGMVRAIAREQRGDWAATLSGLGVLRGEHAG